MLKFLSKKNIKTHLILVVVMVFVPLMLFILFIGHEKYKEIKSTYRNNAIQVVKYIANQQIQAYSNTQQILKIISYLPEVTEFNPDKLNVIFSSILSQKKDNYVMLLAVDNKGKAVSTAYNNVNLDVSDRKYFKDIIKYSKFSVGEYAFSRITGLPVLHYALPVLNSNDSVKLILIASYNLINFKNFIDQKSIADGSSITITDYKGISLFSSDSTNVVGKKYRNYAPDKMCDTIGTLYLSDSTNQKKYFSSYYKVLDEAGKPYLYIHYCMPLDNINDKALLNLFRNILLLLVLAGFILVIVWLYVDDNILKNLEKILESISLFEKGKYSTRAGVDYSQGDIGKLAKAIDSLANNIERREIEQRMSETFLKKMTNRFEIALNSALIGVWDWNLNSDNLQWHDNMFKIYGITNKNQNVSFKTWESFIHAEDVGMCNLAIRQSIDNKSRLKIQFRIIRPDGDIRYIRLIGDVVINDEEKAERMVGVNWDITERIEMENELVKARKKAEESDKLKTIFLANMSHELRTPLNAIIGFSSLIKAEDINIEKLKEYNQVILDNSHNLNQIIGTIIDISIIESGKLNLIEKELCINLFICDIVENQNKIIQTTEKKILNISTSFPDYNVYIKVDEVRLRQIINNLVSNAIKFTDKGNIVVGLEVKEKEVLIYVNDTGIGISKDDQFQIFDRFRQVDEGYSRSYGGTGLGLSISKSLVDLMGGRIWFESSLGIGSTFFFTIPIK